MEIVGAAVGGERMYSRNLRDLLRMKEEDHHNNLGQNTTGSGGGEHSSSGLTLYAILTNKRGPSPSAEPLQRARSNRTLLDIIREDRISGDRMEGRLTWRYLTDKIRLRLRGSVSDWSSVDVNPRRNSAPSSPNLDSVGNQASTVTGNEEEDEGSPGAATVGGEEEAAERDRRGAEPSRMSLMALLAETDRQMGFEGSSYVMIGEDDVDACDTAAAGVGVEYNNCCVCMVRHKGAAFIPCGHTFCRVCSREVWVQRGNCPLCNNAIVEILDIF